MLIYDYLRGNINASPHPHTFTTRPSHLEYLCRAWTTRHLIEIPDSFGLTVLAGHFCALSMRWPFAVAEYSRGVHLRPDSSVCGLGLAVSTLGFSTSRGVQDRHRVVLRGYSAMDRYARLRRKQLQQMKEDLTAKFLQKIQTVLSHAKNSPSFLAFLHSLLLPGNTPVNDAPQSKVQEKARGMHNNQRRTRSGSRRSQSPEKTDTDMQDDRHGPEDTGMDKSQTVATEARVEARLFERLESLCECLRKLLEATIESEISYNLARAHHGLNLDGLAYKEYLRTLDLLRPFEFLFSRDNAPNDNVGTQCTQHKGVCVHEEGVCMRENLLLLREMTKTILSLYSNSADAHKIVQTLTHYTKFPPSRMDGHRAGLRSHLDEAKAKTHDLDVNSANVQLPLMTREGNIAAALLVAQIGGSKQSSKLTSEELSNTAEGKEESMERRKKGEARKKETGEIRKDLSGSFSFYRRDTEAQVALKVYVENLLPYLLCIFEDSESIRKSAVFNLAYILQDKTSANALLHESFLWTY